MITQTVSSPARRRLNPKVPGDHVLAFREHVNANLFGQEEGKTLLEFAFSAAHNPLRNRNKPIAFIINAGKSRSGKTHSVELLAEAIHGNPKAYLRVDMAEYMDKYSLSNLKGSGRGYINNQGARDENYKVPADQKHDYAEFMNHNLEWSKKGSGVPISIVLLDELDKACREVFLLLLGIMDHGKLTLGNGEVVDFTNTIFVCACNLGMEEVEQEETMGIGFNASKKKVDREGLRSAVNKALKMKAPPEFRNRVKELGGIAIYDDLTPDLMKLVVTREIGELQKRITSTGYHFMISVTDEVRDDILARALADNGNLANVKSLISKEIETPLGVEATKKTIKMGDRVVVSLEKVAGEGGALKSDFVFELDDSMVGLFGGSAAFAVGETGHESYADSPAGASDSESAQDPAINPSVVNVGRLLGLGTPMVVLVRRPFQKRTGELVVDQMMSLGIMPDVSEVFTSLHNMTMVEHMAELKLQAERFPELRREFTVEITEPKNYVVLGERVSEVVTEMKRFLGVHIVDSSFTHDAPFKCTIHVKALTESMQLLMLRFKGKIKVSLTEQ